VQGRVGQWDGGRSKPNIAILVGVATSRLRREFEKLITAASIDAIERLIETPRRGARA